MSVALQLIVNGLIAGAIYALVASGFSMIYSTNKFIHFAHGVAIAFSGYMLFFFFNMLGINFWVSIFLALIFSSLLGLGLNYIYKLYRVRESSKAVLLIVSLGLLIFFESLILLLFGASVKTVGYIKVQQGLNIFGAIITPLQIVIILVAVTLFVSLYFFMKKTRLGKSMRAVADSKDVAEIVGISSEKIYAWSFFISSFMAGVAGVLIALEQNLSHGMGTNLMIKGFAGAVIGGIGSVPGSVLGSFILGLVENIGIWFLPSGYKDAIAFTLLFIFLLFIPKGIMGKKK